MKRTGLVTATLAAIVVAAGCSKTGDTKAPSSGAAAESAAPVGTGGAASNRRSDGEFVRDVAAMNLAQIELSRVAVDKATSPDVKLFAQRMIDEHVAAGNQLKSVVSDPSMEWPQQPDGKQRKMADDLAKKHEGDFDHDYVEAMVHGHQDLAARLESRLDVQSLADWKAAAAGRTQTKAMPDPKADMPDVKVLPANTDNPLTMKLSQWAADTYPMTQKHLDTARALETTTKKRATN